MIRLAFAASLLLFATPLAQAASFDCAKAGTPFEKAICASDELSQQDELLAQAYATALGGLSTDAAAEVKAGQKEWLGYAQRICSDDAEPIKGTYTEEQAQCLASTFRGFVFHIDLITIPQQPRGYTAKDKQVYGADNGPACLGLPKPKIPFTGVPNFNDGVDKLGRGDAQRTAPFGGTRADAGLGSLLFSPLVGGSGVQD